MSILDLSLYQETENLSPQQKKFNRQIQKIEKKNQLLLDKINLEKNLNQSKLKAIK